MSKMLDQFLTSNYRRTILRESVPLAMPRAGSDVLTEIKTEIARIDALKLGANLATRDYVSYVNRTALVMLLETLEVLGTFALTEDRDTAVLIATTPPTGVLVTTEAADEANFTGGI